MPRQAAPRLRPRRDSLPGRRRRGGGATTASPVAIGTLQGFRQRPRPSREELLQAGHSRQEIDAQQVRDNQAELISEHFRRWVLVFSMMMCMLLPAMLGLFVWLVASFAEELQNECDVPLRPWVIVVCANVVYHFNCGVGSVHSCLLRCCCKYDPNSSRSTPWLVKLYNVITCMLIFCWHCVGLHWVRISGTCEGTSPRLYNSVKVFAAFSIVFNIFVYVNILGIRTIVMFMLRNGMIHTSGAAPEGTLELCRVVKFDSEAFQETHECSICMDEFDAKQEIRRTCCGHVFHGKCLAGWLKAGHTCPLCRADLRTDTVKPDVKGNADPLA